MRRHEGNHDGPYRQVILDRKFRFDFVLASVLALASIVVSCSRGLGEAENLDLSQTPVQTLHNMFTVQSKNGKIEMRFEAPLMETYDNDTVKLDLFPGGLSVYSYTEDGLLESVVFSDNARHEVDKTGRKSDTWSAFGNVVINNVIKHEAMETDTIYWDETKKEIYTDCYVKMYSPDGFMQGYGMRSDDHARNSILHRPFNSFAISKEESKAEMIDSVNFIGAFPKNL